MNKHDEERRIIIETYLNKPYKAKHLLCPFFFGGFCKFSKTECMYAHGINNLEFTRNNNFVEDKTIIKPRSLKFEKDISYIHFYEFQFEL